MQDQVASTRAMQKFALRLTKAKELSQVTLVLNVELINLFVHQHQPEIAFKSLMECQEIIDSQKTNNDQQWYSKTVTLWLISLTLYNSFKKMTHWLCRTLLRKWVFSAFIVYLVLRTKKCLHVITFLENIYFFFLLFLGMSSVVNICNIIAWVSFLTLIILKTLGDKNYCDWLCIFQRVENFFHVSIFLFFFNINIYRKLPHDFEYILAFTNSDSDLKWFLTS